MIGSGGFTGKKLGWQEHEVLRELEPFWPGWTLGYEPDNVLAPIVHYVRGLGIPLESMNEPDALSDALGKPRWTELTYRNEARSAPAAAPGAVSLDRAVLVRKLDLDEMSIRAANELANGGFVFFGDVVGASEEELASRGVSLKVRRELTEVLEADGLVLGQSLPDAWPAWRAEALADDA